MINSELPVRTAPRCPFFGLCGGCSFQDIPYPEGQIDLKKKKLAELFGREIDITPSPSAYEYRNRMDFVCAFGRIGFRRKGRFNEVVDLTECHLLPIRFQPIFTRIRDTIRELCIPDYDYLTHQGYLRYVVLRVAANTKDLMASFVTASDDDKIRPVMEAALAAGATSVHHLVHAGLSDISYAPIHCTLGNPAILEKIGSKTYRMGPNTFFQNNAVLAENLFDIVKSNVSGRVLDLFCGAGAISLYVADRAEKVLGIEREGESIRFAMENRELNSISNAEFLCQDAGEWLKTGPEPNAFQTLIIDPPRSGLGGKIAKRIAKREFEKIIYVSCNPNSFKDDLTFLGDKYRLEELLAFDMFPQTPHIETVGILKKTQI